MRLWMAMIGVLVGGAATATEKGQSPGQAPGAAEGVIDPKADAALRRMSEYLAGLKSFKVETRTVDEKVTTDGQKIQEIQDSTVVVRRPGQLRVDRVSPAGHAVFRDDGKRFALYNSDKNVYAVEPAPPDLDAAIDEARDRLHIDAPGADLIVSDPYATLIEGVTVGRYIGLEPIGGVMAHHLAVSKPGVDWQIWIQDGPQPVPLRYVITSKDLPGHPQFTLDLQHWQPNARVPEDNFAFTAPTGAKRVALGERR